MNCKYDNLEELLGGYFHQDWNTYADTEAGVLDFYLREWPEEYIPQVIFELDSLLKLPDPEIESEMLRMGCDYNPSGDGATYRDWLNHIANRLNEHIR